MSMAVPLRPGDRVWVRDQGWRIVTVQELTDGRALAELAPTANGGKNLHVVIPPERVEPLPTENLQFDRQAYGPIAPWRLAHEALLLSAIREEGHLTGARFGRVALEAYQISPVLRILSKPRPRLLIADDVGLGKTIESCLCLLELIVRRRADRVLIVVPPGLVIQWQEELVDKFGLDFTVIENAAGLARVQTQLYAGINPWDVLPRVLTSMDYIKKEDVRKRALRKSWDLIIVDEAHALAEAGTPQNPYRTHRTRLGTALRDAARGLILLTATPHNGYSHAFRSLIELIEPTAATFGGDAGRTQERVERAMIRRLKLQIVKRDPEGSWGPAFLHRHVQGIPVPLDPQEAALFKKVSIYCSKAVKDAAEAEDADLVSFAMQIIKKRMLSSRRGLIKTLENRLEALKKEEVREERPERVELQDLQADLPMSEHVAERIALRVIRSAVPADEKRRKAEIKKINEIKNILKGLPDREPKVEMLLQHIKGVLVEDPNEKIIVFTEYRDTLDAICEVLNSEEQLHGRYVILHGGMSSRQRKKIQDRFELTGVKILLATDAASEGLNLQRYCRRIIHVELPWNPSKLEQRNGRVDRYGQTRQPLIRYLYYPDSPEDDILNRLVRKIEEMQGDRISTPDLLGILSGNEEINEGLTALDPGESEAARQAESLVRIFEDRTEEFVRNVKPFLLLRQDTRQDIESAYRLLDTAEPLLSDDLELERFLAEVLGPRSWKPTQEEGVFRIEVPLFLQGPKVKLVYPRATCRRTVAVRTRPEEVEFITLLHPLIQSLAGDARRHLIQVYPDTVGSRPKRLAAKRGSPDQPPSIIFTFYGYLQSNTGDKTVLIEERIIPVQITADGQIMEAQEFDQALITDRSSAGEVSFDEIASLFTDRFEELYVMARQEAARRLQTRAAEVHQNRANQAAILRADLATYADDRRRELTEEEREAKNLIETKTGQIRLWAPVEVSVSGFEAKGAAIDSFVRQREEEIQEFERIGNPPPPQPLGALFVIPAPMHLAIEK